MPVFQACFYDIRDAMTEGYEIPAGDLSGALRIVRQLLADNPTNPHRRVWRVEIRDGSDIALAWLVPNDAPPHRVH